MSKQVLLVLVVVAALAILGALALLSQGESSAVQASTIAGAARPGANAPSTVELANSVGSADARRTESNAELPAAAANESSAAAASGETMPVLVVHKKDGSPAPGAEIWFASREDERDDEESFWTWLNECQLEERLDAVAQHLVADAEGRARIPVPGKTAMLVAKLGSEWGCTYPSRHGEPPFKVELITDANVDVRVVDERGSPVAGAQVALRQRNGRWFNDSLTSTTDAEGAAVLRHVGYMVGQQQPGYRPSTCIALGAALETPVEFAFEPSAIPKEVVKLVMPVTGECEVRVVDPDGQPHTEPLDVHLRVLARDANLSDLSENDYEHDANMSNVRGGIALFHHVALSHSFEVSVERHGSNVGHRTRGLGPSSTVERAVITVRMGERDPVLVGRALDEHMAPLVNTKLHARIGHQESNDFDYTWQLDSDAEGRFQLDARADQDGEEPRDVTIYVVDDRDQELAAARRELPPGLGPGVHELGDFVLLPSPVLVAGVVVDDQGRPIRNANITPAVKQVWDASDPQGYWWQDLWTNHGTSDEQGRFEIHGHVEASATELGLRASSRELKGELVVVTPGATNVTLRLTTTGELAGIVLLDPSVPRDALMLRISPSEEGAEREMGWMPPTPVGEDGAFTFKALRPGSYTVSLSNTTSWDSLNSVTDVRIAGGTVNRDARLDPLDLRATLRGLRIDVVDPNDRPIEQGFVLSKEVGDGEGAQRYVYFQNGKAVLFHSGTGVDVTVSSEGYRSVSLHAVSTDQRVVLRRGVPVRFRLAHGSSAPVAPVYLGVRLEPAEATEGEQHGYFSGEDTYFDARGDLAMNSPLVGRVKLTLTLTLRDDRMWTSTDFTDEVERVIDIADREHEQTFEVTFDVAKLEEQVKSLRESTDQ